MPDREHIELEVPIISGDRSTSLHDTRKSQQEQQRELLNVKALDWITEDEWAMHIQENSHVDRLPSRSVVSIFRVPNVLLKDETKRKSYVPTRVSLGPYHHRSAELPPMNSHKGRALRRMMTRFNNRLPRDPNSIDFSVLATTQILELEEKIRNSYEEKIDCDGKTLALILCLDGCFILEILRTIRSQSDIRDHYEPIFDQTKIWHSGRDILRDILKIENQIPLIVLRKLLELELKSTDIDQIKNHFNAYMLRFMGYFNPFDLKYFCPERDGQEAHHILDLVHRFIVSSQSLNGEPADQIGLRKCTVQCPAWCVMCHQDTDEEGDEYMSIPRAVELRNAGIKFKQCGGIDSIKFDSNSATLFIPKIDVQDSTEFLFRNLIAFEMCKPSAINPVACYMTLMDCLIDSNEDVALLRGMGIVTNYLGSDANVAELFNSLGKEVFVDMRNVFDEVTRKVNLHYKNKCKVQIAGLMKEHFSSPWRALALAAAIVILLLTALQTVFSGLSLP